ncbi:SDR family oxidoreductase [Desulfosudis oleivorans]|uniref:3-dehydrosphinganine reductase n=1 Tax=Desulfosudis oleivorans (strain DSM 6200 / JCM 39069 / Hxd3) TaxID=96561 RepID=A8ZZF7_DESOH|nr:SDR family oxidoreductase [Desulfosudis oleivorans]ABW67310.1 short-chain dehydrogenase/reductase SDR [Desulfosudis oleivorans Hxd3]
MGIKTFSGKRAYVFGGSSGIGLAAARQLAGMGADLALFARDGNRLETAGQEVRHAATGPSLQVHVFPVDVSDRDRVFEAVANAVDVLGPPDMLINCAGRAIPRCFADIGEDQLSQTLAINLCGTWHTIAAALPYMRGRGGHIVNVSSIAGFLGVYGYADYAASKFAVMGLSEVLRSEFKPLGIGVSVLCPPDTDTPALAAEAATKPEETKAISAGARVLSADAVAKAMIRGMKKNRAMIVPGFDGRLIWLAKRLFPGLVSFFMDRTIRRTRCGKISTAS